MTYTESVVARRDDFANGEMKQVSVGDTDLVLIRRNDRFFALHAYCSHYGAPLADGALSDDRIICPWHHACFHVESGQQLEPPGLDSLERFDVRVDGDEVVVRLPAEPSGHRVVSMARRDPSDERTFVVLGGGAAGAYAVEGLREKGYTGRLVMITHEKQLPYDRPNCSKDYLSGHAPEEWMFLRGTDFYKARDVERMHGKRVIHVDTARKVLTFEDDSRLHFDGIVLCTGGEPRRPDVPGEDLDGVYVLRSYEDSRRIRKAGESSSRAVIIGASFIGMEVAWSLTELGVGEVTVVAPETVPFERTFGDRVGAMVQRIHEENGVRFRLGRSVRRFEGEGNLSQVVLDDGTELETDLAIIGIGVRPASRIVSGVQKAPDGAIVVDEYLRAADGVYAAGDVAQFPDWRTQERIRVEHWRLACQHGRIAAYNLAGEPTPYRGLPFFWTAHFGTNIRYVGHATTWDEVVFDGNPEDRAFIAFYVRENLVLAAAGAGRDREMAAIEELMRRDLMPSPDELRAGGVTYVERLSA